MDDDQFIYESMKVLLSSAFTSLHFFTKPQLLIEAIKNKPPHCLLIELNLLPENGLAIYRTLQSLSIAPPTIFLSTYNDTDTVVKTMQAGALDFIEKPFTTARLISALDLAIDSYQASYR